MVDIPVSNNWLSVLKWFGGNLAEFYKETHYHMFESTSVSFEFHRWVSGKTHTADCCFVSGSYWYTQVLSPVMMSQTLGDLPPSNFHSMWVHQSTLPRICSSLRLWGTQRDQRFLTPRQLRIMRVTLPDEILMIFCISVYFIFGVLLNQGLDPTGFFRGSGHRHSTTMVIAFQRSRSRHELINQ